MTKLPLLLVVLVATGLLACEPAVDVEPLPCRKREAGSADLGGGNLSTGFVPLDNGDTIFVQFGPQGMHMIVVSVVVDDFELPSAGSSGNEIAVAIRYQDEVVGGTVTQVFPSLKGDTASFLGLRAVITQAEVEELANEAVEVDATVRDGCGRAISTGRELTLLL